MPLHYLKPSIYDKLYLRDFTKGFETMKVVVIGGVAAGMSAASKLKRHQPDTEIIVYEYGEDLSYGACGMPYYISDLIPNEKALIARTKSEFKKRGIDVKTSHEVIGVDPGKKRVSVKDLKTNETFSIEFDKLIIASGASAIRLPVKGKESKRIKVLSSLEDARELKQVLTQNPVKNVAVIGGGFIGVEMVENLVEMGINAHLIEMQDQVLPGYDKDMMDHVQTHLEKKGVTLHLSQTVSQYETDGEAITVHTDQHKISVDYVIEAIGVKPNTAFLEGSGIKRIKNGAVLVNDKNETSHQDIYSAGDCASVYHRLKDSYEAYIPLGTHANKAGRIIAEQLSGNDERFKGVIGSSILKAFDLTVAKTGLTEKEAKNLSFNYGTITVKVANQAGYYPGAKPIHIKVIYDQETCVIKGAQMVGEKGIEGRINIFASIIWNENTAKEVSSMDLAYAPPFSPVWDSIQIATNQIKCRR